MSTMWRSGRYNGRWEGWLPALTALRMNNVLSRRRCRDLRDTLLKLCLDDGFRHVDEE